MGWFGAGKHGKQGWPPKGGGKRAVQGGRGKGRQPKGRGKKWEAKSQTRFAGPGAKGCQPDVAPFIRFAQLVSNSQAFLDTHMDGLFDWNRHGRHALHELCECMRKKTFRYSEALWLDLLELTADYVEGGVNILTKGIRPPEASILSMAAKQPWKCMGCQPSDQIKIVAKLLQYGADINATSGHGNTVLMEVAGARHTAMFKYFHDLVSRGACDIDFEPQNKDGRNL